MPVRGGVEGGASGFYHRGKFAYVRTRETCDEGKILCISAEDMCVSRRYRTYLTKISHVSYEDTAALLLDAENRAYLTKISRVSCEDIACILRRYRAYLHVISSNHIPHVPDCYTRSPPLNTSPYSLSLLSLSWSILSSLGAAQVGFVAARAGGADGAPPRRLGGPAPRRW